jgi:hypothetical protein
VINAYAISDNCYGLLVGNSSNIDIYYVGVSSGRTFAGVGSFAGTSGDTFTGIGSGGSFSARAGSIFAGMSSGSIFVNNTSSGSTFAGMSSGNTFVGINQGCVTNAITNMHFWSTVSPLSPLEESVQPVQSFVYWVPAATWLEELKLARHSIDEFALLEENWDGYGAASISDQARKHAHHFINEIAAAALDVPVPEVSPKPTGTISFEWEAPHAEVYIEIGNTRYSGFIKTDQAPPVFLRGHADSMDQQIVALIQRAIAAPPTTSAPTITEIRAQSQWWHEQPLAA